MKPWIVLLTMVSMACGSATAPSTSPPYAGRTCAERQGTYLVTWAQLKGGTCGAMPIDPTAVIVYGVIGVPANCDGGGVITADGCSEAVAEACPATSWTKAGTIAWNDHGSQGTGTISATYAWPSGEMCSAAYAVTYQRQ